MSEKALFDLVAGSATLCLDVGNTTIYAGLYDREAYLRLGFRKTSSGTASADEYGVFLRATLRENGVDPSVVGSIGLSSVVPDSIYSIRRACEKYFHIDPFILRAGVKTGLRIDYKSPQDVGADRIANAVAAVHLFPGKNCVVADFGTATTIDVVTAERVYLGGAITAGLRISMEALESRTARLPVVEIINQTKACGKTTVDSIQSGLFLGHVGMVRELVRRISEECFGGKKPIVIGTGGFSPLFAQENILDHVLPDLVLTGLYQTMLMNRSPVVAE